MIKYSYNCTNTPYINIFEYMYVCVYIYIYIYAFLYLSIETTDRCENINITSS